jgi:hypothetical protein
MPIIVRELSSGSDGRSAAFTGLWLPLEIIISEEGVPTGKSPKT